MSVFATATAEVTLPILTERPEPDESTQWTIVLNSEDQAPWIQPCTNCAVVEGRSSHQAGCDVCRGRGWFSTRTGLPVKVWWWEPDRTAAANWLLHTFTPTLLRLAGHSEAAGQVDALPALTEERLGKRLVGTGLLERITDQMEHQAWDMLPAGDLGGKRTPPGWSDYSHPVWARASDARWQFGTSRLGWWAYRAAAAAADLIRVAGISDDLADPTLTFDDLLWNLVDTYDHQTAGLLMLEEDQVLGPELPAPLHDRGFRCESRTERAGIVYQCDIDVARRVDVDHSARGPEGPFTWTDAENIDVPCTATLTTTLADASTPVQVQCEDTRYRHQWVGRGVPDHHWYSPEPTAPEEFPDFRSWTDTDAGATAAAAAAY